ALEDRAALDLATNALRDPDPLVRDLRLGPMARALVFAVGAIVLALGRDASTLLGALPLRGLHLGLDASDTQSQNSSQRGTGEQLLRIHLVKPPEAGFPAVRVRRRQLSLSARP